MAIEGIAGFRNFIIRALPESSREVLASSLEPIALPRGQYLYRTGERIEDLYFIEEGMVSLVRSTKEGHYVEVGTVGPEGIAPPTAVFDVDHAVLDSMIQMPVRALRIDRKHLAERLAADRALSRIVRGYVAVALSQLTQTAACNILHHIEQRCSRWLLTAHDSALADRFVLTHEFLAMMLGVRRASVSTAAETLQRAGYIRYSRGNVAITDRHGLERFTCECYGAVRDQFKALFGRSIQAR